jgi:phospholipid transport system transporter-binding protein
MMRREGARLVLEGRVDMDVVPRLLAEGAGRIDVEIDEIDLSGVTEVDSAALALLLEWRRQAASAGAKVRITNIPQSLAALADLYGMREFL